jgi:hypothetical protein
MAIIFLFEYLEEAWNEFQRKKQPTQYPRQDMAYIGLCYMKIFLLMGYWEIFTNLKFYPYGHNKNKGLPSQYSNFYGFSNKLASFTRGCKFI